MQHFCTIQFYSVQLHEPIFLLSIVHFVNILCCTLTIYFNKFQSSGFRKLKIQNLKNESHKLTDN